MKKILLLVSIGLIITGGLLVVSYDQLINRMFDKSKSQTNDQSVLSVIRETNEPYRDEITPQTIYLNNTKNTITWTNLSNNAYTIVVDDSSDKRENVEHIFVSKLLHKGDSTQFSITEAGSYHASFVEEMTSRGWVNLLPPQKIIVTISD